MNTKIAKQLNYINLFLTCHKDQTSDSASDIQDYIEYIIKIHEAPTTILLIHVYINRINNRLALKVKDGYKLELQMPETMKLFGSTKKLTDKTKHGEKVQSFEVP